MLSSLDVLHTLIFQKIHYSTKLTDRLKFPNFQGYFQITAAPRKIVVRKLEKKHFEA